MIIVKPFAADKDPNNHYTTRLYFLNGVVKNFYLRGSIAWPEGKKEGFAIMSGLDLTEKVIIVFEQYRFWTIDHWYNDDGTIHERDDGKGWHLGLMQFIADNIAKYRCCSYYRGGQHVDVWNRYGKEVYTNEQCPKRLELIEIPFVPQIGPNLLLEKINTGKFRIESETWLANSVVQFVNTQAIDATYDNATLALMTLLAGFDYAPWVKLSV